MVPTLVKGILKESSPQDSSARIFLDSQTSKTIPPELISCDAEIAFRLSNICFSFLLKSSISKKDGIRSKKTTISSLR